jgi:hypothetical protein
MPAKVLTKGIEPPALTDAVLENGDILAQKAIFENSLLKLYATS